MARPSRRDQARALFAQAMIGRGRQWENAAESVRQGFENCWISAGLDAVEALVLRCGDDEEGNTEAVAA